MAYQIGEAVLRFALLASLCLTLPFLSAVEGMNSKTLSELKEVHPVDLRNVVANPDNYEGLRVKFRAIFATHGALFDTFHTRFTKSEYINLVVYDDQSLLASPEVRANPVIGLYYRKARRGVDTVSGLKKYQVIDVTGEVVSSFNGDPYVDIHDVSVVPSAGVYSDASVFLLQQAARLADDGIYDLAEQNFQAALKTNLNADSRVAVLESQAINLLAWGKYQESIKVLDEAIAAHKSWTGNALPTKLSELYYLSAKGYSEAAAESKDAEMAKSYFEKSIEHAKLAVRSQPEHGDAFAILGIGLSGLEQYDLARTHCQRAILMRPSNAEIRWYLGRILDRQGDYDEAIAVLNKAIDLSPKDYRIHKTIAMVYLHKSETGGKTAAEDRVTSLREFDIAIRLNSTDADLFYYSGLVIENAAKAGGEIRIGRKMVKATKKLAADRYHKCENLDETYLPAIEALAKYYRGIEKHDEAVGFYKKALALAPEREEMYSKLGTYFSDLGRLADAYDVYAAYQKRQPKHLDTLYALGNLSLQLKEYKRAADWHEELVKNESKYAKAHADLSDSYVELGNWREVVTHADLALGLLEDDAEKTRVSRKKGIALWAQDNGAAALAALNGQTEGTKDIRVLLALGWSQTLDPKAAANSMATAKAAVALDAKNAEAKELLGQSQYLAKDYAGAEKTFAAAGLKKEVAAYRLGMSVFMQGPERYADAKPLLKDAKNLRDRRSIYKTVSKDVSAAERTIRDYERKVASDAAAAKRAADKKAYEDKKAAEAAARKKAAEDKKKADAEKRRKADEAKRKAAADKKAKEAARRKAIEDKKKADAEKRRKAAEAKRKAAEAKKKK